MSLAETATDTRSPQQYRDRLADQLLARQWVRLHSAAVEAAVRTVPRHLFVPPDVDLAAAYADDVVITRRDVHGKPTSSVSAPWLQAYMIEVARLRPAARVLEIGSGGYNAALLAEVVGPDGAVTSIDIDAGVVDTARTALACAGYPQVRVERADAEDGFPDAAPYDAIIVTVEAADIPPAFNSQLAPGGVLVVPLRMRGNTRCLTLIRRDEYWEATAAILCGFVPMQGAGSHLARPMPLRGDDIVVTIDDSTDLTLDPDAFAGAFDRPRAEAWAPVFVAAQEPFESLHLWLACQPHPYGLLAVNRDLIPGLLDPQNRVACPTLLAADSLAYLALRKLDEDRWQFGAHGIGAEGADLAATLADMITSWDREYRHGPGPRISVHPTPPQPPPTSGARLLVPRRHTTIAVTWPAPSAPR